MHLFRIITESLAAFAAALLFISVTPSMTAAQPTAAEIITNVRAQAAMVKDYTANIRVTIDMPGVQVPEMKAKMYFKAPDKVHLDTDGFAMIPRDAVAINPNTFDETAFDMVIQGKELVEGTLCYKVKLLAKSDTLRIQRAMVLVDPDHWIMRKVVVDPKEGNQATVVFDYTLIDSRYFLPSKLVFSMDAPPMKFFGKQGMMKNEADESKPARIIVKYSNYKVNKGISDAVFKEKSK